MALVNNNHFFRTMFANYPDVKLIASQDDADMMDMMLISEHGGKYVSPLFTDTDGDLAVLSKIIHYKYIDNWNRMYDAFRREYNPIENYSMTEREESSGTQNVAGETNDDNLRSIDSGMYNYGFNSTDPVPTSKSTEKDDYKGKTTRSDVSDRADQREMTRAGNIGVTTSQQMIESELKLRAKYNLVRDMINDVAKELTCPYYATF